MLNKAVPPQSLREVWRRLEPLNPKVTYFYKLATLYTSLGFFLMYGFCKMELINIDFYRKDEKYTDMYVSKPSRESVNIAAQMLAMHQKSEAEKPPSSSE